MDKTAGSMKMMASIQNSSPPRGGTRATKGKGYNRLPEDDDKTGDVAGLRTNVNPMV